MVPDLLIVIWPLHNKLGFFTSYDRRAAPVFLIFFYMAVITKELNEQISENPGMDYSVLIVLKDENLPSSLVNKGQFIMENKIFSAKISGAEIQNLRDNTSIEAIEPDMEMTTL
jgi:hypothetical protein